MENTALCSVYGCVPDDHYFPDHECQCNRPCIGYNDCCTDFIAECGNTENTVVGEDSGNDTIIINYDENNVIFASIIMVTIFILMIITIIQYILMMKRKHITNTRASDDNRMVIIGTFISITFYFVCCLCYLIGSIALFVENDLDKKASSELASIIFWSFGFAVMQFVIGGRLYFTFKNTPYSYPKSVYILLCAIFVMATCGMMAFEIEFNSHDWHNPTLLITTVLGFTCHIIFLFLVVLLYIRAFFKIALNRSVSLLKDEDNDQIKLLMDHTARITLLTGIVGIVTICAFIIWCIFFTKEDQIEGGQGVSFLFLNTAWWLLPSDALINAICLFLKLPFKFTDNIYSKLCYCCHAICVSICTSITTSLVAGENSINVINQQNELTTMNKSINNENDANK